MTDQPSPSDEEVTPAESSEQALPPTPIRRYPLPMALSGIGGVLTIILGTGLGLGGATLGWGLVLVGILPLVAAFMFYRELSEEERVREEEAASLEVVREGLREDMAGFENRRREFEKRLMTYSEWLEFPELDPIVEETPPETEEVRERDRKVAELTDATTTALIENFRNDAYSEDGEFRPRLLISDVVGFVEDIARIHRPDSESPLLETTPELLLKALNRISLQLLFQIEQLPINAKDYNLRAVYDNARKASKLYGHYKSLSPYMPLANTTWQLGRLILTSNPLSAGTWFLGSEALRRGGQKIARHYVDRYAFKLTGETVRIFGNEAAMLFDPEYRYREVSWIYGVELGELVASFPLSRETLQHALDEIGSLPLRSSYDRVFLYRCIAGHKSPKPSRFVRPELLDPGARQSIARRLERFYTNHVHGRGREKSSRWATATSARLGVSIHTGEASGKVIDPRDQTVDALRSIAGYLLDVKGRDPEDLRPFLAGTATISQLPMADRPNTLDAIAQDWPAFFEYPDLEPASPVLPHYLADLTRLESESGDSDLRACLAIRETASYFRAPWEGPLAEVIAATSARWSEKLCVTSPEKVVPAGIVFALPKILTADERPRFVYRAGVRELGKPTEVEQWLLGTDQQMLLFVVTLDADLSDPERARLVWRADLSGNGVPAELESKKEMLGENAILTGGQWLAPGTEDLPGIRLPKPKLGRRESYFAPLLEACGG